MGLVAHSGAIKDQLPLSDGFRVRSCLFVVEFFHGYQTNHHETVMLSFGRKREEAQLRTEALQSFIILAGDRSHTNYSYCAR